MPTVDDIRRVAALLSKHADLSVIAADHPKLNGYTGFHMRIDVPVYPGDRVERAPVELQNSGSRGAHPGAEHDLPIHPSPGGRSHMSAPILSFQTAHARRPGTGDLRLRLKPAHRSCGSVQGAWWPRTNQLHTELAPLLAALWPRVGSVDRIIYDEISWASAPLRIQFEGHSIVLEGSASTSTNTLSLTGDWGRLVLLVVPPCTNPARAYAAVMTASTPDDVSTPDALLGIGSREAQDRRLAVLAQQRWESEGGALRHLGEGRGNGAAAGKFQVVRRAQ